MLKSAAAMLRAEYCEDWTRLLPCSACSHAPKMYLVSLFVGVTQRRWLKTRHVTQPVSMKSRASETSEFDPPRI